MQQILTKLFLLFLVLFLSCTKKEENIPAPIITSLNPTSGTANTQVIISGNHFSPNPSQNIVKFNNTLATVTVATVTQLTTSVPQGSSTGNITVSVNGQTATSPEVFTIYQSPTITNVNPASGIIGTSISITGTNFNTTVADNIVKLNGIPATVTAATTTQLTATVPVDATTGKITVTVQGLTTTSSEDFTVIQPPVITNFSPTIGKIGATITITGNNFSPIPEQNTVKFNNITAVVTASTLTQIVTTVPAGATKGKITVTVNDKTVTSDNDFNLSIDQWIRKDIFLGDLRTGAVGFAIQNMGYIGTGHTGAINDSKDFWEYNSGFWLQRIDFAGGFREEAVGFAIGDKGYIGMGYGGAVIKKDFWEFDPVKNQWTQKADYGGIERSGATGFAIGNKGYVGTGDNDRNIPLKDFWEYDPTTNQWTRKADFGGDARTRAVGFSINDKGFIGTGVTLQTVGTAFKDFWEYNPVTDQWVRKADFGGTVRHGAIGFVIGNKGYLGTGRTLLQLDSNTWTSSNNKDFWEYDPTTNQWTRKADCSDIERQDAVGFAVGSKGYVLTGNKQGGYYNEHKYVWEYTP